MAHYVLYLGTDSLRASPSTVFIQAERVATGTVAAGESATITATWDLAFRDDNYMVVASIEGAETGDGLRVVRVLTRRTGNCDVRVINTDALNGRTGTLHAIAVEGGQGFE